MNNIYHENPQKVLDYELHIESAEHIMGDPIPHVDFSEVYTLFKIDPAHPLVNIEQQIARAKQNEMGPAMRIYYLTVRRAWVTVYPEIGLSTAGVQHS